MKENLELSQARDFGGLINDTFVFTRQNWKPLLKSLFAICGFFVIGSAVAGIAFQSRLSGASPESSVLTTGFGVEVVFVYLFSVLTYTSIALTTFCYISVYKDKGSQAPSVEEVWAYFKYYFWRFLGAQIVFGLLCGTGFVFCILPGIYLLPIISIMLGMIVFENAGISYVFNRSFKLIRNEWWSTFGAMMIVIIVIYAVFIAVLLPVAIFSGVGVFVSKTVSSMPIIIATTVLQNLGSFFIALSYIVVALAYFSLVEKKEGLSLMDKIDKIGKEDGDAHLPQEEY